jgi:hypothetical protein
LANKGLIEIAAPAEQTGNGYSALTSNPAPNYRRFPQKLPTQRADAAQQEAKP